MQVASRRFFDYLKAKYEEKNITVYTDNDVNEFSKGITEVIYEKEKALMTHIALNNIKDEYREILLLKYLGTIRTPRTQNLRGIPHDLP